MAWMEEIDQSNPQGHWPSRQTTACEETQKTVQKQEWWVHFPRGSVNGCGWQNGEDKENQTNCLLRALRIRVIVNIFISAYTSIFYTL